MLARGKENPPPVCYICKGMDQQPKPPDGKFVQLVSHGSELYALTEDGSVYLCRIGTKTWVKWHEKRR